MNASQVQARKAALLVQEQGNPPAQWWMSFCDPDKPKGQRFIGVVVVEAPGFAHAHQKTWALGVNPGGEVQGAQIEGFPAEYLDKLLSRVELEEAGLL